MIVNAENLATLRKTFGEKFTAGFTANLNPKGLPNVLDINDVAMISPILNAMSVEHAWLTAFPGMEKWIGTRPMANLSPAKMTVVNEPYANGVAVPKRHIEKDTYGLYSPMMEAMGVDAQEFWRELFFAALLANGNWADGAAFFGTTRRYGANTIVNKTTSALSSTTFKTALKTMRSYIGHNNKPLKVRPNVLVVGPALEDVAFDLVINSLKSAGSGNGGAVQNWARGVVQVAVAEELVGAYENHWYLFGTKGGMKAGYVQREKDPTFESQTSPESDSVFLNGEFRYGVDGAGAAFLALPHCCYAGIVAAS